MANRYFYAAIKQDRGFSGLRQRRGGMSLLEARYVGKAVGATGIGHGIAWLFILAGILSFGGILLSITGVVTALGIDGGAGYRTRVGQKLRELRSEEPFMFWSIGWGPFVSAFFTGYAGIWWLCLSCVAWGLFALIVLAHFQSDESPGTSRSQ